MRKKQDRRIGRWAIRPLSERQLRTLATGLLRETQAQVPEWTGRADSDPGVTLLSLFAFLAERLRDRPFPAPSDGAAAARRLSDAALALAGAVPAPACGVERVAYFEGRLLGAADFVDEQSYFRTRLRRRNLYLHGAGVVSGLKVSLGPAGAGKQSVVVEPGFALDPRGEEIEVCRTTNRPLPRQGGSLLVQLQYVECPTHPVPSTGSPASTSEDEEIYSRIEESFKVLLTARAREDSVSIARLTCRRGRWRVDRRFKPPRAS